jgi:hypothetical protein
VHVDFTNLSWVGVIVAAVAGLVIGFLWYSPQLFGRRWAAGAGIQLPTGTPSPMILAGSVVLVLITAYVLAVIAKAAGVASIVDGALLGFLAWLGFVLTWTANGLFFERKPTDYVAINAGQGLVSLVVMGAIIGYFR